MRKLSLSMCALMLGMLLCACGQKTAEPVSSEAEGKETVIAESQETSAPEVTEAPEETAAPEETQDVITDSVLAVANMSTDFYYIIEDTFELVDREDLVVVGVTENSPLYTGAEVDILSATGRIQSQVIGIENYSEGLVESVESGANVGVMLAGVTKEQVKAGDMLVLRDRGMITDKLVAMLAMVPMGEEQTFAELTAGQNVEIVTFDAPVKATVEKVEILSEEADGDIVAVALSLEEMIPCQNYQMVAVRDEAGNSVAAGRFAF